MWLNLHGYGFTSDAGQLISCTFVRDFDYSWDNDVINIDNNKDNRCLEAPAIFNFSFGLGWYLTISLAIKPDIESGP